MASYHGRFLWYELMTTDPKAAEAFYPKVVGWGSEPWPGSPMPYTLFKRGATPVAGMMELPEEARKAMAPPHWLPYVGAPEIDATAAKAAAAGAKTLMGPQDIPSVGRVAVMQDPQGAVFGLYRPAEEPAAPASPEIGDCSWHELAAADEVQALSFYSSLFGWEKHGQGHDMGPMGVYQEYQCPGMAFPLGGIYRKPAEMPGPPHFMLYFHVADVNAGAERVKANGGQVLNGPMEVPGGDFIVNCADPQGAAFSLHHSARK